MPGNGQKADNALVTVYPNPFTSQIKLLLHGSQEDKYSMRLYDISGREVWRLEKAQADQTFEVGEELETGVYILVVNTGKEAKQYKLVKAR